MLRSETVLLTPEIAQQWKLKNTNNFRVLDRAKVDKYASEMASGNWELNGETIAFYEDGTLANGQHRIEAVVKSGVTIETLVAYGVKKKVKVFDMGSKRTLQQMARAMGLSANNPRIATANFVLNEGKQNKHGDKELIAYYESLQDYFDMAYSYANRGIDRQKVLIKAGSIAAIWCAIMLNIMTEDKLEAFCRIVNSGMPFSNYVMEPALVLRNMIIGREIGPNNGRDFMRNCFNITWQALTRFEKQVKNKYRYKAQTEDWQTVISKAKVVATLYSKTV